MNAKFENYKKILDNYIAFLKLDVAVQPNEVTQYLAATTAELKSFNAEDCATGAYILSQYALYIQKECNKEQSQVEWANDTILKIIGPALGQYKIYDREACRITAINDNEAAKVVWSICRMAQSRVTQLSYLAKSIENMATRLENLRRIKYESNRTN